jgi:hypothetical protein
MYVSAAADDSDVPSDATASTTTAAKGIPLFAARFIFVSNIFSNRTAQALLAASVFSVRAVPLKANRPSY